MGRYKGREFLSGSGTKINNKIIKLIDSVP